MRMGRAPTNIQGMINPATRWETHVSEISHTLLACHEHYYMHEKQCLLTPVAVEAAVQLAWHDVFFNSSECRVDP